MLYRPYQSEDFPALYAIEEVCFRPPERFSRAYMRQVIQQPHTATWIAELEAQMLGFAIVEWTGESSNLLAYIQTLEVLPGARGQGVGGELLARLEASAIAAAAGAIWLHVDAENLAAIRLYIRHGYSNRGREPNYYGRNRPGLVYAKAL